MGLDREQTTIRLPRELKEEIQKQADKMGVSFNEYVLTAIIDYLNHLK